MHSRRLPLALAAMAALLGPAGASAQATPATITATTFVISGRGWGHGVGMSQWGAYGYAQHGFTYDRILAHYYPRTTLASAPVSRIKVLLVGHARFVVVSSPDAFRVRDGSGVVHDLAAGNYRLDSTLSLQLAADRPAQPLPGPLTFLPGKSPLWLAHPYRGSLRVSADGKAISVVNVVGLDAYVRGVVSSEMPQDWPLEAVKAQAVAARSYALTRRTGGAFDVFNDTRDQVYGGILAETPSGDEAVAATSRQVLLYDGKVARTYYFSSSGGRTAAVADVFADWKPTPYLVSVPDPYDAASPYHTWGPVVVPGVGAARKLRIPGLTELRPEPATGRAREIVATGRNGDVTVSAGDVRAALGLRSTWFSVGVLALSRPAGPAAAGSTVTLTGHVERVGSVVLEQRTPGGDWQPGPALSIGSGGTFTVPIQAAGRTQFRLVSGTIRGAILNVVTAPS